MMKRFIIYTVKIMLIAEKLKKRDYSKELYLLTFFMLMMINGAFIGSFVFLAVRLNFIESVYARNVIAPIGIFFIFAIPITIIFIYRRKIDVNLVREKVNELDDVKLKKEMTLGIILIMLSSCSILIALSILSILIKFNVI